MSSGIEFPSCFDSSAGLLRASLKARVNYSPIALSDLVLESMLVIFKFSPVGLSMFFRREQRFTVMIVV